jgi:hypothetical protein
MQLSLGCLQVRGRIVIHPVTVFGKPGKDGADLFDRTQDELAGLLPYLMLDELDLELCGQSMQVTTHSDPQIPALLREPYLRTFRELTLVARFTSTSFAPLQITPRHAYQQVSSEYIQMLPHDPPRDMTFG